MEQDVLSDLQRWSCQNRLREESNRKEASSWEAGRVPPASIVYSMKKSEGRGEEVQRPPGLKGCFGFGEVEPGSSQRGGRHRMDVEGEGWCWRNSVQKVRFQSRVLQGTAASLKHFR